MNPPGMWYWWSYKKQSTKHTLNLVILKPTWEGFKKFNCNILNTNKPIYTNYPASKYNKKQIGRNKTYKLQHNNDLP